MGSDPRASLRRAGMALLLAAMVAAAYAPVRECGFVFDDFEYVLRNHTLRSLEGLGRIWTDLDSMPHHQYYPVVLTSFWIEYQLWGLEPTGYHVVNVVLHVVNALLLWRLLRALCVPGAWLAAALFAVHPVHVESVAWVTERKNLLSTGLYFAAALAYLRFAGLAPSRSERDRGAGAYVASLLLFALALASKAVTCTLPAALMLILWWKREPLHPRHTRALAPHFGLALAFGALAAWAETNPVGAAGEQWSETPLERALIASRALWFYAGKLVWPHPLTFVYEKWDVDAGSGWQYLPGFAAGALALGLWRARDGRGRAPLVALLFFAGTLAPTLGFVSFFFMRYSYVADHFQYLASAGPLALAAAGGWRLATRPGRAAAVAGVAAAALVLALLGSRTSAQVEIYRDPETLWRHTLDRNPRAWLAHLNLGAILAARGEHEAAIAEYRRALPLLEGEPAARAQGLLGASLLARGRTGEAIELLSDALALKPEHPDLHYNMGVARMALGDTEGGIRHFRRALAAKPTHSRALHNLGSLLAQSGRLDEAISAYRRALAARPDAASTHANLGLALEQSGRVDEAIVHLRRAVALDPSDARAHELLRRALARVDRGDAATRSPR